MPHDHIVTLDREDAVGLDRLDPHRWTVCSARDLLPLVSKPADDSLLPRHEQAVEFLRALDHRAVLVSPNGGDEFQVSPYAMQE